MTIRRLLKSSSLPPEGVDRLVGAYQQTLRSLDLVDRHDPIAEIVAKKVIEIGKRGGDAIEIAKLAVDELARPIRRAKKEVRPMPNLDES